MPGPTLLSARVKGSTGSWWQKSGDNPPSFALQDVTCKCQSPESTNGPYGPDQLTCPCPWAQELYLSSTQSLRLFLAVLGQCWAPPQPQWCLAMGPFVLTSTC